MGGANPPLPGFDQDKWAAALQYGDQSGEDAIKLIALTRKQMAAVLSKLPQSAFDRTGQHSERGRMRLSDLLRTVTEHLEHHMKFIHAKRAKMGKEMW